MNIPFIRYFKRERGKSDEGSVAVAPRPVERIEKPASERFGKTVLPNSSRIVGLEPGLPLETPRENSSAAIAAPTRKISLGGGGAIAVAKLPPEAAPERTIALRLADVVGSIPADLLKPDGVDPDRQILLQASEVERGMSTGRPTALLRVICKQAPEIFNSEVAATDQREVALPFARVVEQFASFQVRDDQIPNAEYPELETPFLKVTLEDGEKFGQPAKPIVARKPPVAAPEAVAPAKAPAAIVAPTEPTAPAKIVAPIRLSAPASIPPAPVAAAPVAPASTVPAPVVTPAPVSAVPPPPAPTVKAPLSLDQLPPPPVAAKISPNGTGAPAAERVPASSGSPVPTPLPSPFAPLPARIPFKITPPSDDLRTTNAFPAIKTKSELSEFAPSAPRVSLPLRSVLRDIPPFQLSGPIDVVPETARIEIPFSIIQPQLSLGRVTISPAQFQAALPEEHRAIFKADESGPGVPLSLQDILQNLPTETLQLRGDQDEPDVAATFETPFSQKASEDAVRMKVEPGVVGKTSAAPAPGVPASAPNTSAVKPQTAAPLPRPTAKPVVVAAKPTPTPPAPIPAPTVAKAPVAAAPVLKVASPATKEVVASTTKATPVPNAPTSPKAAPVAPVAAAAAGERSPLQSLFNTDEALDAKAIVAQISRQPGVGSCAIVFSDGLSLAGNIPAEFEADALCAMAPSILQRVGEQMFGAKFGAFSGLTLFCAKAPISLFARGNICLAAVHSNGEIAAEVRARLLQTTQELARIYALQPNA